MWLFSGVGAFQPAPVSAGALSSLYDPAASNPGTPMNSLLSLGDVDAAGIKPLHPQSHSVGALASTLAQAWIVVIC